MGCVLIYIIVDAYIGSILRHHRESDPKAVATHNQYNHASFHFQLKIHPVWRQRDLEMNSIHLEMFRNDSIPKTYLEKVQFNKKLNICPKSLFVFWITV